MSLPAKICSENAFAIDLEKNSIGCEFEELQSELFRRSFSEVFSEVIFGGRDTPLVIAFSPTIQEYASMCAVKTPHIFPNILSLK